MTRLTKALKDEIVDNAVKAAGFNQKFIEIDLQLSELGEACRVDGLGGPDGVKKARRLQNHVAKVGESFGGKVRLPFLEEPRIDCNFAGERAYLYFKRLNEDGQVEKVHKITPLEGVNSYLVFNADHPLTQRWREISKQKALLKKQKNDLIDEVYASLSRFTTVKNLVKHWPEVEELIPAMALTDVKTGLPAVPVSHLNALIGLPTEEN